MRARNARGSKPGAQKSRARPAFKSWDSYRGFAKAVQQEQRFAQNADSRKFLMALRKTSRGRLKRLQQGHVLCRAQVGHDWDPIYFDGEPLDDFVPAPFKPERMVPDPKYVGDGRANPRGIAYMYLAERIRTAIAEVRPWVGAHVSLGFFEVLRDLKLVDCSLGHRGIDFLMRRPMRAEWDKLVWKDIDRAFATPVDPADSTAYIPTQIIAEVFRDEGWDGIAYHSALGEGRNFLIFDLAATNLIACRLHIIKGVDYKESETGQPYGFQRKTKTPASQLKSEESKSVS